jgi:uncharacterized RDD family membrane protein YckC
MDRIEPTFNTNSIENKDSAIEEEIIVDSSDNNHRLKRPLADIWQREVAQTLDFLVSFIIFSFCLYITNEAEINKLYSDIIIVIFPCIYFVFSDGLAKGQSLGKRIFNISVIDNKTGRYCTFSGSLLRNLFTPLTGILDVIIIVFKRRRRLGDLFAGTIVIKNS